MKDLFKQVIKINPYFDFTIDKIINILPHNSLINTYKYYGFYLNFNLKIRLLFKDKMAF
jgi:hypothetical protein